MDIAGAQAFLATNHHAVLATTRKDGRPQLSPVLAVLDDQGRIMISTLAPAVKTRNIRRDPRVTLALLNDGFYGEWGQVEGTAEIIEQPEALELLVDYYRRAAGEHPDWDDYRAAMVRDQRVVIRVTIERAGPTVSG